MQETQDKQVQEENTQELNSEGTLAPKNAKLSRKKLLNIALGVIFVVLVYNVIKVREMVHETQKALITINTTIADIAQKNNDALTQAVSNIAKEGKEAIARALEIEFDIESNSKLAKEAMAMADKAVADGDIELGLLYARNALFHLPSDYSYIRKYYDLLTKNDGASEEELQQLQGIINVAVFQVAPSDVQKMLSIRDELSQKIAIIAENRSKQEGEELENERNKRLTEANDELNNKLTWSQIIDEKGNINIDLLGQRQAPLQELLENVNDEAQKENLSSELANTQLAMQVASLFSMIDNVLNKTEKNVESGSSDENSILIAQSQLQSASGMLAQFWVADSSFEPKLAIKANTYQNKIKSLNDKLLKKASQPILDKIHKNGDNLKKISRDTGMTLTKRIKEITNVLKEIQQDLPKIVDADSQRQAMDKMEEVGNMLTELEKQRIKKYNEWAICRMDACRAFVFKLGTFDKEDETTMMPYFDRYLLGIDTTLLTQEAQQVYWTVFGRVFQGSNVKDEVKAKAEIKKAKTKLVSLENF